jgi:5S rRNA maturation endonuclease (ribonuclease M5)
MTTKLGTKTEYIISEHYHLDDCFIISAYSYDDRDNLLCIKNMASIVFDYDASGYEIRHALRDKVKSAYNIDLNAWDIQWDMFNN